MSSESADASIGSARNLESAPSAANSIPGTGLQKSNHTRSRWFWWFGIALLALTATGVCVWGAYRASVLRTIPSQIASAELSLRMGQCDRARSRIAAILFFVPDQPDALSIIGRCLLEEKQVSVAIDTLEQIPDESTAYEKAGFALATACLQSGDLERAESVLERYLQRFPTAEAARNELRWLYFNQFRTREVEQILEEKLQLQAGDHQTLADLLDCDYRQQVPHEGVGYLEQINRLKPGQGTVALALGYAYWRMGQADAARTLFRTAIAKRPDDPHVRFTAAAFLIEQGQIPEAEKIVNHSAAPEDDRYWSLLSQLAELKNDPAQALQFLDRALEKRGNDYRYASRRASLLRKLGRTREIEGASQFAYKLQQVDRELANIVEADSHHKTTRREAVRIAGLYEQTGRTLQSKHWGMLASRLPEGNASP